MAGHRGLLPLRLLISIIAVAFAESYVPLSATCYSCRANLAHSAAATTVSTATPTAATAAAATAATTAALFSE